MYGDFISLGPLLFVKFSESWPKRNVIMNSGDDEKQNICTGLLFFRSNTQTHTHTVTHTHLPKLLQTHLISKGLFLALLHSTFFCNSKSQSLLSQYQRWHFMYKHNLTLWHLERKSYMQYINMKEITGAQAMEVSFDSANTLYSAILSNSQLRFGILSLKLNVGRRRRWTVL